MDFKINKPIQFQPFSSNFNVSFWKKLGLLKLNEFQLSEAEECLYAIYTVPVNSKIPAKLWFTETSFDVHEKKIDSLESKLTTYAVNCRAVTTLRNFNTTDNFRKADKNSLLTALANKIWMDIYNGRAIEKPHLLVRSLLLSFADLKTNRYLYWLGIPAFVSPRPFKHIKPPIRADSFFTSVELAEFHREFMRFASIHPIVCHPFFIVRLQTSVTDNGNRLFIVESLLNFDQSRNSDKVESRELVFFGFIDPCPLNEHPGWPLRNFLMLISARWHITDALIFCFRANLTYRGSEEFLSPVIDNSIILHVDLEGAPRMEFSEEISVPPAVTGWEVNRDGKLGPRLVDLSSQLDPLRLAEQSVDLNVRLMRWRLLPNLDVGALVGVKCLLLGAGKLGCNVARCLLGWGIRRITFVDHGRVKAVDSASESLYGIADIGKYKSTAAVESLRRIFPGVTADGRTLHIPANTHFSKEGSYSQAVEELEELIAVHDVIFLLISNESACWIPTVIATFEDKTVFRVFVGNDKYQIIRHGGKIKNSQIGPDSGQLGCCFCSSRENFMGKTTVHGVRNNESRSGLFFAASALAVELMVGVVHHCLKHRARGDTGLEEEIEGCTALGILPHEICASLQIAPPKLRTTRADPNCIGCSEDAVEQWKNVRSNIIEVCENQFNSIRSKNPSCAASWVEENYEISLP